MITLLNKEFLLKEKNPNKTLFQERDGMHEENHLKQVHTLTQTHSLCIQSACDTILYTTLYTEGQTHKHTQIYTVTKKIKGSMGKKTSALY